MREIGGKVKCVRLVNPDDYPVRVEGRRTRNKNKNSLNYVQNAVY